MNEQDLTQRLADVRAAEGRLVATLDRIDEAGLRQPSLLPGWTRGHVLAHVALNAHSLVNLFEWARTGVETPQYPGWAERDSDIERYAGRTHSVHRAALDTASGTFEAAARAVPPERWETHVRGIGGEPAPADTFLFGRLREVEIHHVDLDAEYGPADWDDTFVRAVLGQVPAKLSGRVEEAFVAEADDVAVRITVGGAAGERRVAGPGHALLAWLLGRSDGAGLKVEGGTLPSVPAWG